MTRPLTTYGAIWVAAFGKPSKLWRPLRSWNPREWTLLDAALDRIKASVGPFDQAAFDLHRHLVEGRMKSALRHLYDATEHAILPHPKFWQQLRIIHIGSNPGYPRVEGTVEGRQCIGGYWTFFVRRADLDKHYPVGTTPVASRPVEPSQRRRGPATTHDWHSIDGEIARRCIDTKTGRVRVPKNETALAHRVLQWLEDQDLGQPAESEMREAVKRVCAALRTAQK
jgi:hypothetical protein